MPEAVVVERSATLFNLLQRTLDSAQVPISRHFERFSDAVTDLNERLVDLRLPDLLIIGIPEKEPAECETLLKMVKDLPAETLPLLILSHAPLPKLDRWLANRGRSMRLLWSQFWQLPGAIDELAPALMFSAIKQPDDKPEAVRILLIDDSVSVRKTYQQLLSAQGFVVDLAESIREGLQKIRVGRYDLIIVDYFLPDGTGDELVTKVKADPATKSVSIALITATYKDEVIQRALDAGAIECMFKNEVISLTLARIKALVRSIEDRRQIEQERQRLLGILRSVGDGVYGLDDKGRVTFMNHTGCKLLGMNDESEIIGLSSTEFTQEAKVENTNSRVETLFRTHGGRMLPVELSVVALMDGPSKRGSVVVFRDISERKNVERVRYELEHDRLTGLCNRRSFMARLVEFVAARKTENGYGAVLMIDIDRYTQVLENAGEVAAQQLLVDIGQRLQARLRDNDTLARLEHDQFVLKLEGIQLENVYTIADGLRENLRDARYLSHSGQSLGITVSIGVAIISKETPSAEYALENARQACGQAKRRGQNQTQIFVVESDARMARDLEAGWATRIKEAMAEDRLILLAQPIVPIADVPTNVAEDKLPAYVLQAGKELIFEILIRLVNRDGQLVSPSVFVPLAERFNLMPKVDLWVIARAVRFASRLPDDIPVFFAINLSNQTLIDPEALTHIENTFASHRVAAKRFIFEVSETGEIAQLHNARRFMIQLKQLGARFALDDFGSGQNSISHLKWLPIDLVKVNGEFVANKSGAEVDRAMALSLTQMAHSLKLGVIAERVDSPKSITWLRAAKVDYIQGNVLGAATKLEDIDFDALF
jgi:diguanylate cyclase (GGDEF)-like protein/PAS domain S-box-containing protein